jgi:hypothetical protein
VEWNLKAGTRDTLLYLSGLAIIWHEVLVAEELDRPGLLVFAGGMVGLPAVVRGTGALRNNGKDDAK